MDGFGLQLLQPLQIHDKNRHAAQLHIHRHGGHGHGILAPRWAWSHWINGLLPLSGTLLQNRQRLIKAGLLHAQHDGDVLLFQNPPVELSIVTKIRSGSARPPWCHGRSSCTTARISLLCTLAASIIQPSLASGPPAQPGRQQSLIALSYNIFKRREVINARSHTSVPSPPPVAVDVSFQGYYY